MPTFPEPPYFLLVAGLLAGIASGLAFKATLEQMVQAWSRNRSARMVSQSQWLELRIPFIGISAGICAFLGSGLEIFGFPYPLSYIISLPLTLFTSFLVWWQLGKLLSQLERGGSQALDLDSWG